MISEAATEPVQPAHAARLLGVSKRALYELAAPRGPIPCHRPSARRIVFELADLRAYLDATRYLPVEIAVSDDISLALTETQVAAIDAAWAIARRVAVMRIASKPETTVSFAGFGLDESVAQLLFDAEPPMPRPDERGCFSVTALSQWIGLWASVEKRDGQTTLYRHYDVIGQLLYVGVSFNVLLRTRQHQIGSPWFETVVRVETEEFLDRRSALHAETAAIRSEHPLFNIRR